jgi:putative dimethyl sulfoxide reductase chaperone
MDPTNEAPLSRQELAEIARIRASFCAFVNVHFTTLPDLAFVQRIRGNEFMSALKALANDEIIHTDLAKGASLMQRYVRSTLDMDETKLSEQLGVDRTKLYRGVSPGYGPQPLYEAVWGTRLSDATAVLRELAGIYRESGMAISPDASERLDYVGVELDYQQQLALREAEAWEAGEEEKAKGLLGKEAEFLGEHLGQWVPAFIEKAVEMAETDFYRGHMLMLRGFLADEQERLRTLLDEA